MSDITVDYNDERFKQVEADKQNALTETNKMYDDMISQTDGYYNAQIEETRKWAEKQQQIQQEQTDFAIEQIEQQKDQGKKDYTAEQSAAYTDYQKQSNKFGVEAEQMAANGLANTGFSESSKVSMYNTYQNRVATARNSYNQIIMNYNNSIKEAQLQNNSKLAEIAYNAMWQELELTLQGFQHKNQLLEQQANKKLEVDSMYYNRYMDVLNQINQEKAFAEEIRQYNESMQLQREQLAEQQRQFQLEYDQRLIEYNTQIEQFDREMKRLEAQDKAENEYKLQQLELQKQEAERAKIQWEQEMALKKQQLEQQQQEVETKKQPEISETETTVKQGSTMSGKTTTKAPSSIDGYGNVTKTYETYYVNGKDEPIYATGDGTWWYWNEDVGIWIRLAKNYNKPSAVASQEILNKVMGTNATTSIVGSLQNR